MLKSLFGLPLSSYFSDVIFGWFGIWMALKLWQHAGSSGCLEYHNLWPWQFVTLWIYENMYKMFNWPNFWINMLLAVEAEIKKNYVWDRLSEWLINDSSLRLINLLTDKLNDFLRKASYAKYARYPDYPWFPEHCIYCMNIVFLRKIFHIYLYR